MVGLHALVRGAELLVNLGKRPRQGNDVPIVELALIVLKPITFTAFSNPDSFLYSPILLLLFRCVSCHGTRGFNLPGAKHPAHASFCQSCRSDSAFISVASISVTQSTRCLLSAIPLQHLLPPPNAPHQASKKGTALLRSLCMRLLGARNYW